MEEAMKLDPALLDLSATGPSYTFFVPHDNAFHYLGVPRIHYMLDNPDYLLRVCVLFPLLGGLGGGGKGTSEVLTGDGLGLGGGELFVSSEPIRELMSILSVNLRWGLFLYTLFRRERKSSGLIRLLFMNGKK